jgi:hypothetical protein
MLGERMKAKTIKIILRKKIDEWLKTIKDESLRQDLYKNCMVTGGAIASMLLQEEPNDYDIYLTNKEITKRVAEYYVKQFEENPPSNFKNSGAKVPITVVEDGDRIKIMIKSQGIASEDGTEEYQYFEQTGIDDISSENFVESVANILNPDSRPAGGQYRPVFLSSNAITLSDDIQIIIRFYGEPEEIHSNYDFVHCLNYWVSETNNLVLHPKALEALLAKELVYVGSKYPLASIIRTRKFIQRGFTCNAGQYLKMCWQVSELCLKDIKVLEDQLVGVDAAYFNILIKALKAEAKGNDNFQYNYNYILEVIDKIF